MARKRKREGISIKAMTITVMVLIGYLCWGVAASSYLGRVFEPIEPELGRRLASGLSFVLASFGTFLVNSLRIDQAPAVFMNSLRNHPWHFGLFLGLEGAAVGFGLWLKKVEQELNPPTKRRKRRPRPAAPP